MFPFFFLNKLTQHSRFLRFLFPSSPFFTFLFLFNSDDGSGVSTQTDTSVSRLQAEPDDDIANLHDVSHIYTQSKRLEASCYHSVSNRKRKTNTIKK
jgi:hypothetical protein